MSAACLQKHQAGRQTLSHSRNALFYGRKHIEKMKSMTDRGYFNRQEGLKKLPLHKEIKSFFTIFPVFSPNVGVAGVRDRLRASAGIGAHFRRRG
jgi:hypothetical protein